METARGPALLRQSTVLPAAPVATPVTSASTLSATAARGTGRTCAEGTPRPVGSVAGDSAPWPDPERAVQTVARKRAAPRRRGRSLRALPGVPARLPRAGGAAGLAAGASPPASPLLTRGPGVGFSSRSRTVHTRHSCHFMVTSLEGSRGGLDTPTKAPATGGDGVMVAPAGVGLAPRGACGRRQLSVPQAPSVRPPGCYSAPELRLPRGFTVLSQQCHGGCDDS